MGHVFHCVDALRQDIICHADDTPLYTTGSKEPVVGPGQSRQCRDWNAMDEWAMQYNGCFSYVNETASSEDFPEILRWVHCPEGSPYAGQAEEALRSLGF